MKLTTNMVIQICSIVVQVGTAISAQQGLLSPKALIYIGGVVTVAQAVSAYLGHVSNPDGTPASR